MQQRQCSWRPGGHYRGLPEGNPDQNWPERSMTDVPWSRHESTRQTVTLQDSLLLLMHKLSLRQELHLPLKFFRLALICLSYRGIDSRLNDALSIRFILFNDVYAKCNSNVGIEGFEPPTSRSQTERSDQAELYPDNHRREESSKKSSVAFERRLCQYSIILTLLLF